MRFDRFDMLLPQWPLAASFQIVHETPVQIEHVRPATIASKVGPSTS